MQGFDGWTTRKCAECALAHHIKLAKINKCKKCTGKSQSCFQHAGFCSCCRLIAATIRPAMSNNRQRVQYL